MRIWLPELNSLLRTAALSVCAVATLLATVLTLASPSAVREKMVDAGVIMFAGFGATALLAFCFALAREGKLTLEARFGTLGGGNKGYSVSQATALFLLILAYLLAFLGFAYSQSDYGRKKSETHKATWDSKKNFRDQVDKKNGAHDDRPDVQEEDK